MMALAPNHSISHLKPMTIFSLYISSYLPGGFFILFRRQYNLSFRKVPFAAG